MEYLTFSERKNIGHLHFTGTSLRAIGRVLCRSHSTIKEELKRAGATIPGTYDPHEAQRIFLLRQAKKGKRAKIARNQALQDYIIHCLKEEQWSPEEIAGALREKHGRTIVCHETIYAFIYSERGKALKLWLELRHKKKPTRQMRAGRTKRSKICIPDRTPLVCRGEVQFGDCETDSMIFSQQQPILSVQVEKVSKRCVLTKLPNKTAEETLFALTRAVEYLGGKEVVRSMTFDNGTENVRHTKLKEMFEIQTYFCDPYSSWQKGLVENTNKLIRQYLPRYTDMSTISQEDIFNIQEKLNNRPRKNLHYKTPNQVYNLLRNSGRI
jgi:IS30 family transposase